MPADPVTDNSSTWNWLLDHQRQLREEFSKRSPAEMLKLEMWRRKLSAKTRAKNKGGNTDLKNQFKIIWACWKRCDNWQYAYRYDVTCIDRDGDLTDWNNYRIKWECRINADYLEDYDTDCGAFSFDNALSYEYAAAAHGAELVEAAAPALLGFDKREKPHEVAKQIIKKDLAALGWLVEYNGVETYSEEARRFLRANKDAVSKKIRGALDGIMLRKDGAFLLDVKQTVTIGNTFSVEADAFARAAEENAILFFVAQPDSQEAWRGAMFARDFEPAFIDLFGESHWECNQFDYGRLRLAYPNAVITQRPYNHKLSGKPLIVVPRVALVPIAEFIAERVNALVLR